jgi:hypothetical protein
MANDPKLREPTFKELMENDFHVEHLTSNLAESARIIRVSEEEGEDS